MRAKMMKTETHMPPHSPVKATSQRQFPKELRRSGYGTMGERPPVSLAVHAAREGRAWRMTMPDSRV